MFIVSQWRRLLDETSPRASRSSMSYGSKVLLKAKIWPFLAASRSAISKLIRWCRQYLTPTRMSS